MAKRQPKLTQDNFNAIRNHIFDRIHKTGEEVKNDFPNLLRTAIEREAWKHFHDGDGRPFKNLVDWLLHTFPNGPAMGLGKNAITYEEAMKLTEGHPEVHRVLAKNVPKGAGGRRTEEESMSTSVFRSPAWGSKANLSARLARQKPEFYEAYQLGKYKTITAAAMAAGLLKDDVNLRRGKSAFRKMTSGQRADFQKWLRTKEAKDLLKQDAKKRPR